MICVVSIVDSISTTSMPVNEFVLYRCIHKYDMKQILLVCDTKKSQDVNVPNNVKVYLVGSDRKRIREAVKEIQCQCGKDQIVYHMHHQKSALAFLLATLGMGVRKHTLYTVHSTYSGRDLKYKISSCICSSMANYANCVSNAAYEEYAGCVKRLKGKKFVAIANGVDVDRIDAIIANNPVDRQRKRLICVGRMIPLKNHEFLIRLMKQLPDFSLVLVGAEDREGRIRKLAQDEGVIDRIEFKGLIPRDEVFRELNMAGLYVSASHIEGLPVSVLEAMRAALIPIISEIKPHSEIQLKCKEIKVLPLNEEIWVSVIRNCAEMTNKEYVEQCEKIRDTVKQEFSLDNMHTQYMSIYEQLK